MIDITHTLVSLSAAGLAFGNPRPGLHAWLLPVHVSTERGRLPAVLQLQESIASQRAQAVLAAQLGVLPPPEALDRPLAPGEAIPPAGWVHVEPTLLSFRFLRSVPPDALPALSRNAAERVRGESSVSLGERLPAAAAQPLPVARETYYALVCAREGVGRLDARSTIPARPAARQALLGWLSAAVAQAGYELNPARPVELTPLQQALALGEQFAMAPANGLPAWLADAPKLPGTTLAEGLSGLARSIEQALDFDHDRDLWFDEEPPPSDPLH